MDNITLLFIKHLITISLPYVMKNRYFSVFKYSLPVFVFRLFQRSSKKLWWTVLQRKKDITYPNALSRRLTKGLGSRDLVPRSASMFSVSRYMGTTFISSTLFRTANTRTSIALVFFDKDPLFMAIWIAD